MQPDDKEAVIIQAEPSTVSGSTGSSGSVGNFAVRVVQNTFVASQIDLKGWGCWSNMAKRICQNGEDTPQAG